VIASAPEPLVLGDPRSQVPSERVDDVLLSPRGGAPRGLARALRASST
jgi:hypothetical protein